MKILVIGIGTYLGNDQFGLQVVSELSKDKLFCHRSDIKFTTCVETGASLLNLMQGFKTVYLIDAVKAGACIGKIFRFEDDRLQELSDRVSSHSIGLADTIELGKMLDILPLKIKFYGMEIGEDDDPWQPSRMLETNTVNFIKIIKTEIHKEIHDKR